MANITKIRLSGVTYTITDEGALHALDSSVTSGGTNAVNGSGIYNAITASSAAVLESVAEAGYQTSGDVESAISTAISDKVDNDTYTAYTAATDTVIGGKLNTSDFNTYSGNVDTVLGTKFAGAEWSSTDKKIYFYDNSSATGTALAYIDGTDFVKDGFLQSVTIENKTISGESVPCLVFIWNTDAGIQETDIPISGIFDPSNYYNKSQTDSAIVAATSGKVDTSTYETYTGTTVPGLLDDKQDTLSAGTGIDISENVISVTGVPLTMDDTVTSGSSNPVKSSGIYNALTEKQDTLVSGTNIKTVGNTTVLGSGNIALMTASIGTGNDSETLIFDFA